MDEEKQAVKCATSTAPIMIRAVEAMASVMGMFRVNGKLPYDIDGFHYGCFPTEVNITAPLQIPINLTSFLRKMMRDSEKYERAGAGGQAGGDGGGGAANGDVKRRRRHSDSE